jgi:hypothetical protein
MPPTMAFLPPGIAVVYIIKLFLAVADLRHLLIQKFSSPTPVNCLMDACFDQQADSSKTGWILGSLIPGWQIGLPLIHKGGEIKLIVPSSLAYGCGNGPLPANSILYFDIHLVDVQ